MSRDAHDREDLLAEAKALVERACFQIEGFAEPIIAGFRRDGSISFFFGAQPVYQFNAAGQLRRAFANELLYKAEDGHLVALRREQQVGATALVRHELSSVEAKDFITSMNASLATLGTALVQNAFTVIGQAPANAKIPERIRAWLREHSREFEIAQRPNVGG